MDEDWALEVFDKAPYVTVSMIRPDGIPYGLPLSVVRKDNRTFYFHCAAEGEKIDCIRNNPVVSLSAVSRCTPRYEEEKQNFTEYYHSAIALGHAETVTDDNEKIEALRLICERFLPKFMDHFEAAIARSLSRTTVIRIILTEPAVGKMKG
jgi:nitroimidazol reductase NimA-like FMN-containing flavoprotein (pyridoxamine 5'-phosphate oxidase superfamily)